MVEAVPASSVSDSDTPNASIKGVAVREFVRWYAEEVGAKHFRACVESMPKDVRQQLDEHAPALGLVSSKWYPAKIIFALMDAIEAQIPAEELPSFAMRGAAAVMDVTLSGVYRILFRMMATPERYAKYGQKLWLTYYDSGSFIIVPEPGGNGATCTISRWKAHHPLICAINRGASIAIYRAMGCREVGCVRESCVSDGATACRFVTRWKSPAA